MNISFKNKKINQQTFVIIIIFTSLLLWTVAAILPAYVDNINPSNLTPGIYYFILGPLSVLIPVPHAIAWSANFFAFDSMTNLGRKKYGKAKRKALIAIICSMFALLVTDIPSDAGFIFGRLSPGVGVMLWILSFVVLFTGAHMAPRFKMLKYKSKLDVLSEKQMSPKNQIRIATLLVLFASFILAAAFVYISNK